MRPAAARASSVDTCAAARRDGATGGAIRDQLISSLDRWIARRYSVKQQRARPIALLPSGLLRVFFFLTEIRQDLWAVVIGRFMELKNGFFFFNRFSLFLPFLGNA